MIKAVLFDLDGTLLDREASVHSFIKVQYDRLNDMLSHIPRDKYIARFIELDNHGYRWKDKVYKQLVKEFNIEGIMWEELLLDYMGEFSNHCIPFPGLLEMLRELKENHYKLGIISNGKCQFQLDNIRALDIEKYFDTILISECEGMKKPDSEIFIKASEKLNVSLDESIFVGDHPLNDIKAAQSVEMIGIWKRNFLSHDFKTNLVIDNLKQLPYLIKNV